jgi:uncharacterized integral membrane protein
MLYLIVLTVVLLFVVIFALQNAEAVTIRFLFWRLESSMAILALAFTAAGVLIAELLRLANRLLRWKRGRHPHGPPGPPDRPGEHR